MCCFDGREMARQKTADVDMQVSWNQGHGGDDRPQIHETECKCGYRPTAANDKVGRR